MLLEIYRERKLKFRDPKIKKKLLWQEIVNEFKEKNYNINEAILDRKMRNLKKSYRNLVDNNKKTSTGRGRINWEWYNNMEEIFKEDRTVHIGPTLSSITMTMANNEESNNIPSTSTACENILDETISATCSNIENNEEIEEIERYILKMYY